MFTGKVWYSDGCSCVIVGIFLYNKVDINCTLNNRICYFVLPFFIRGFHAYKQTLLLFTLPQSVFLDCQDCKKRVKVSPFDNINRI